MNFYCFQVCKFAIGNIFCFLLFYFFLPSKISSTKLNYSLKELKKRRLKKIKATYYLAPLLSPEDTIETFLMTLFAFGLSSDCKVWVSGTFLKHKALFKSLAPKGSVLQGKAGRGQLNDDVWICQAYRDFLYPSRTHILICQGSSTLNSP